MVVEIRTSQDLLNLLDNNEEFRRAARRALLTDDLLELPDLVREMQQTQRLMIQRMDRMDARFEEMGATVARIDGRVDVLSRQVGDMNGRLRGWELERESVAKLLPRLAREYGVERIRAVSADSSRSAVRVSYVWEMRFEEAVEAALNARRITAEEEGTLSRTDIVARGRRGVDGPELWFAVQVSATLDNNDIERAAAGAGALRKVSGDAAVAVVYGRRIAGQQRVRADELGVAVMLDEEGEQG